MIIKIYAKWDCKQRLITENELDLQFYFIQRETKSNRTVHTDLTTEREIFNIGR